MRLTQHFRGRNARHAVSGLSRIARKAWFSRSAVSTIEFALLLPTFLTVALMGTETAHYVSVRLQISQIALSVADNASRLGQTENTSVTPTLTESDVDSVMFGALQQGRAINLEENGRVILSSLELDDMTGRQWFHWQRCRGDLARNSSYGPEEYGLTGTILTGVGRDGRSLQATQGSAVMVAEVFYQPRSLFGGMFGTMPVIHEEAVFTIRDDRNLGDSEDGGISPGPSQSSCS